MPSSLAASVEDCDTVTLRWNASTDSGQRASGLAGYRVFRNGSYFKTVGLVTSTPMNGLLAETQYSFAVSAIDAAGNESARSGQAFAMTPGCATPSPTPSPSPSPTPSPSPSPSPDAGADGRAVGAGKSTYSCPTGGILLGPGDDVAARVAAAPIGATFCIQGEIRVNAQVTPKTDQSFIGVTTNSRLSGAKVLSGWTVHSPGVWVYSGALAARGPNVHNMVSREVPACYEVSTYQDDVFHNDRRVMRVLSLRQLTGLDPLPRGQAVTGGEVGRFFFDYANDRIFITLDPTGAKVDLAVVPTVFGSAAPHVKIRNLFIEKALAHNVAPGRSWNIQDATIRLAHNDGISHIGGASYTDPAVLDRVLITNNGQFGISGSNWVVLRNSEISWNNIANYRRGFTDGRTTCGGPWGAGASKFVHVNGTATQPGLIVSNVNSHHNYGDGFWTDIDNKFTLVENSRFHHNERFGYFHEISCDITMTGNEFDNNGLPLKNTDYVGAGLHVLNSNNGKFTNNLVHNNRGEAIMLGMQGHPMGLTSRCFVTTSDTDVRDTMKNNRVTGNIIYSCTPGSIGGKGMATLESRNNFFENNQYHVPDATGTWWKSGTTQRAWNQWRSLGHDNPDGTVVPGSCTLR